MVGLKPQELMFLVGLLVVGFATLGILGSVVYFAVRLAVRHERDSQKR